MSAVSWPAALCAMPMSEKSEAHNGGNRAGFGSPTPYQESSNAMNANASLIPAEVRHYDPTPATKPGAKVSAALAAAYVGTVKDMAGGLQVVLQLVERNMVERGTDQAPSLNDYELGCLLRLAIRGCGEMTDESAQMETMLGQASAAGVH